MSMENFKPKEKSIRSVEKDGDQIIVDNGNNMEATVTDIPKNKTYTTAEELVMSQKDRKEVKSGEKVIEELEKERELASDERKKEIDDSIEKLKNSEKGSWGEIYLINEITERPMASLDEMEKAASKMEDEL